MSMFRSIRLLPVHVTVATPVYNFFQPPETFDLELLVSVRKGFRGFFSSSDEIVFPCYRDRSGGDLLCEGKL